MRQGEAMAILEDRAKRQPRDVANELAAENERVKRSEDYADLLNAAKDVLDAWEHGSKHPAMRNAIGALYDAYQRARW